MHTEILVGNPKVRDHVYVYGRLILKLMFKKQLMRMWNGFTWLSTAISGGLSLLFLVLFVIMPAYFFVLEGGLRLFFFTCFTQIFAGSILRRAMNASSQIPFLPNVHDNLLCLSTLHNQRRWRDAVFKVRINVTFWKRAGTKTPPVTYILLRLDNTYSLIKKSLFYRTLVLFPD